MIIIGLDPHPATFTAAVLDASTARVLGTLEVDNSEVGHQLLHHWVHQHSNEEELLWAVEGASNPFCAAFVAELLARGEHVTDIAPSLTSQYRSRRGSKKNDVVDAQNAAKALRPIPPYPPTSRTPNSGVCHHHRNRARLADDLKANRMALKALPEGLEGEGSPPEEQPRQILSPNYSRR